MPNYVRNIIVLKGNMDDVKACLDSIKSIDEEDGTIHCIDFNKIIPMPEEVKDTVEGSETDFCLDCYKASLEDNDEKNIFNKLLSSKNRGYYMFLNNLFKEDEENGKERVREAVRKGEVLYNNEKNYGAATWYRWANRYWGTKWNALSTEYLSSNIIAFNTAWDGVPGIIKKLSQNNPNLSILYGYADEDKGGVNVGAYFFSNGGQLERKLTNDGNSTILSEAFAERIWNDNIAYLKEFFCKDTEIDDEIATKIESSNKSNILGYIELYVLCTFADDTATITKFDSDFTNPPDKDWFKDIAKSILESNCKLYNKEPVSASYVSKEAYKKYIEKYGADVVCVHFDGDEYSVEDRKGE